jgi:hypothetical protein
MLIAAPKIIAATADRGRADGEPLTDQGRMRPERRIS